MKKVVSVVALVGLLIGILGCCTGCGLVGKKHFRTEKDPVRKFEEQLSLVFPDTAPLPLELGEPTSAVMYTYVNTALIFQSEAYTLLCSYDAAAYAAEKAALETRYSFRTERLLAAYQGPRTVQPEATIGDDYFRFLIPGDTDSGYNGMFYKHSLLVVTNDERQEIGYVLFNDMDLDYVESLSEFLENECGWSYVRRDGR